MLIAIFGQISGSHFNPAVTMAFVVRREIGLLIATAYVFAQLLGATLGTWAAHIMFQETWLQIGTQTRAGGGLWFSEVVATFGLVITILGTMRWKSEMVPITVGLYIGSAYWFTASTSFANPAVTFARSFTDTFVGIQPTDAPPFIVFQLLGALLAAFFFSWMFDRHVSTKSTCGRTAKPVVSDLGSA